MELLCQKRWWLDSENSLKVANNADSTFAHKCRCYSRNTNETPFFWLAFESIPFSAFWLRSSVVSVLRSVKTMTVTLWPRFYWNFSELSPVPALATAGASLVLALHSCLNRGALPNHSFLTFSHSPSQSLILNFLTLSFWTFISLFFCLLSNNSILDILKQSVSWRHGIFHVYTSNCHEDQWLWICVLGLIFSLSASCSKLHVPSSMLPMEAGSPTEEWRRTGSPQSLLTPTHSASQETHKKT